MPQLYQNAAKNEQRIAVALIPDFVAYCVCDPCGLVPTPSIHHGEALTPQTSQPPQPTNH
jgi:hypothetical protein